MASGGAPKSSRSSVVRTSPVGPGPASPLATGGMKARRHDGKRGVLRSLLERVQCRDSAWRDIAHVARDKDETMLLCCRGE